MPPRRRVNIKVSEKQKSTLCSAIQVKNWRKKNGIEEKLGIISRLENLNELLTYAIMSDLLMLVYVQFLVMLVE